MLYWSALFLLLALSTGVLGFTGPVGLVTGLAKMLSVIFLLLLALSVARYLLNSFW